MEKIKILTDSNSGISQEQAKEWGVSVVPMPFSINLQEYLEGVSIDQSEFYRMLEADAEVFTSQPSKADLEEIWNGILKEYQTIIYIPMSSGLSGTYENAKSYAEKYDGKVLVIDNKRISLTQKESVLEAVEMVKLGKSAKEIKEYLESTADRHSIYITMGVLKYLKKGGRISPAAATLGSMLRVKPILSSRGQSFDRFALAMSMPQAKKKMIEQIRHELETVFLSEYEQGKMVVSVAHTNNLEEALKFKEEIIKELPELKFRFVDALSLSVSCHIGSGALAVAISVNNFIS